jgi:CxxC motif-containing protein
LLKSEGESISGYSCSRGFEYAKREQTDPRRSISGSVHVNGCAHVNGTAHRVLPVKTSAPIPKDLMLKAAALLGETSANLPIKTGDIIIADILGTGINFIAARSLNL